jgi:hypothetical protein
MIHHDFAKKLHRFINESNIQLFLPENLLLEGYNEKAAWRPIRTIQRPNT